MSESIIMELIAIGVCILMSGFFSGTETALTSLSDLKLEHLLNQNPKAKDLHIWRQHPNKVLNTILIGNNIVNILGSVLAAHVTERMYGDARIALVTGVMTFLVLIFGEITPKTFAKHNAALISIYSMKVLKLFYFFFYPISFMLNKFVKALIKITGGRLDKAPKITEDELEFMIKVGEQEGVLQYQKRKMLHNIIEISEIYVKEVMVPRTDLVAINSDCEPGELWELVRESEFSRIPVYEGDIDNVVGILFVKDLLKFSGLNFLTDADIDDGDFSLKDIIRKPYFVPETKKIDDMLTEFQKTRNHLAVVIDEYGGVAGVITLEDILEEIVGEIWDEFDTADDDVVVINKETYIVDVRMDIDDFCERFEIEKTEDMEEYETLGGFIFDLADKIPDVGEIYKFDRYRFKILTKDERKLDKIEVKRITAEQTASHTEAVL